MAQVATLTFTDELEVRHCPTCSISFGVPVDYLQRKREKGGDWHCPNGHTIHFTETEVMRLKKELEREQRLRTEAENNAEWNRQRLRKAERTHKREMTKIHVRVGNGVCPECHRTFDNLQRHMNTKHPEFKVA